MKTLFYLMLLTISMEAQEVKCNVVKTNWPSGQPAYYVWAKHPTNEVWSISATLDLLDPYGWFTPPGYKDENGLVSLVVSVNQQGMFFKARKRR